MQAVSAGEQATFAPSSTGRSSVKSFSEAIAASARQGSSLSRTSPFSSCWIVREPQDKRDKPSVNPFEIAEKRWTRGPRRASL